MGRTVANLVPSVFPRFLRELTIVVAQAPQSTAPAQAASFGSGEPGHHVTWGEATHSGLPVQLSPSNGRCELDSYSTDPVTAERSGNRSPCRRAA